MASNLAQWKGKAERASKALARLRQETQAAVVHVRYDVETVGAGLAAGFLRGAVEASGKDYAIPLPGGMTLAPEVAIGSVLLGLAFADDGDASRDFHSLGSGILAYGMGDEARRAMMKRAAAKAAKSASNNGAESGNNG